FQHGSLDRLDHHLVDRARLRALEVVEVALEAANDGIVQCRLSAHAAWLRRYWVSLAAPAAGCAASKRSRCARKRPTAASCAGASSSVLKTRRKGCAPGRSARYQPTCLRALRTPRSSPWNA